jgi:DNA modification methylase
VVNILQGDCREVLKTLADESVHCVVTSPPYFGLRDYGVDGQIGLEPSPGDFVEEMVAVFGEVRRVLRSDGTLWLNLGDSYTPVNRGENARPRRETMTGIQVGNPHADIRTRREVIQAVAQSGLKQKDLMGIPWMVALALRADGWYLRSDIIWAKKSCMPESVTDRPTKSHEYVFLLSKSERYYYDMDAIAEPLADASVSRLSQPNLDAQEGSARVPGKTNGNMKAVSRNPSKASNSGTRLDGGAAKTGNAQTSAGLHRNGGNAQLPDATTRNARTVWSLAAQPFKDAHFATMPPALAEKCILAGCPEGGTVLDPFGGAGTTGLVADRHKRDAILIELNPEYADMAKRRIVNDAPLFAEVS